MKTSLLLVLLIGSALAQSEAPHKFWDAQNKRTFVITAAIRAADAAQSCYHLANTPGWSERWLPAKSCAPITLMLASGQGTQTFAQWTAHKTGHHKLERVIPWVWVAPNAAGIALSFKW